MHEVAQPRPYIRAGDEPFLEFAQVDYVYPDGKRALQGISFKLYRGDRLAVVGKNGAGKTTLAKLIASIYRPTSGKITSINDQNVGMLFQDCDDQLFCPTIFEDIAFGLLLKGFSPETTERQVLEWARRLDIERFIHREPHHLSYGERKRAALAAVLAMDPDILILDEPTVGLDRESEGIILDVLSSFQGTIVCVSHDLFFLYELCQRAFVLKNGMVHHDYTMEELVANKETLRDHGLDFTFRFQCCAASREDPSPEKVSLHSANTGNAFIELQGYSYRYPSGVWGIKKIDLKIGRGERVALIGENGAGKSTLALCLSGIFKGSGVYRLDGEAISEKRCKKLWQRVGIVFQDSRDQFFSSSCFEEVAFGLKRLGIPKKDIEKRVKEALAAVKLDGYEERVPHHLSGGEQKRLALATILVMKPDLIILDEPTNNLDPQGEESLIEIINSLNSTFMVISHDVCFLSFICDRAVILHRSEVVGDMNYEEFLRSEQESVRHHHEHGYRQRCCHRIRELFYG